MRSFVKVKSSRNGGVILSFTDIGKSCPSRDFLTSEKWLLMLYAKIKFSQKFPNLQCFDLKRIWRLKYLAGNITTLVLSIQITTALNSQFQG